MSNTHPLCKQIPAAERAAIVGREIRSAIRSGEFDFVQGYLKRVQKPGAKSCTYGGCAIAALAFVAGARADANSSVNGSSCRETAVDTGLVTMNEAYDLENAYEGDEEGTGPFAALGRSLRKYAAHRGGRARLGYLRVASNGEAFYTIEQP